MKAFRYKRIMAANSDGFVMMVNGNAKIEQDQDIVGVAGAAIDIHDIDALLDILGFIGWELVSTCPFPVHGRNATLYVMKRPD